MSSEKLNRALSVTPVDWDEVTRVLKRLKSPHGLQNYMNLLLPDPDTPFRITDVVLEQCQKMGRGGEVRFTWVVKKIWKRLLTGTEPPFENQGRSMAYFEANPSPLIDEWHEYIKAIGLDEEGGKLPLPHREQVVLALERTAVLVRARGRGGEEPGDEASRRRNSPRLMPILHLLVYNRLPLLLVWIAAQVYPEQLQQLDSFGNLPLHYANWSAYAWHSWHSPLAIASAKPSITAEDGSPLAKLNDKFGIENATAVQLLTTLYPNGVHIACPAGRTPLMSYLWSLLDYHNKDQLVATGDQYIIRLENRPARERELRDFLSKDIQLLLDLHPNAITMGDPTILSPEGYQWCVPFVQPALVGGLRFGAVAMEEVRQTQQNNPTYQEVGSTPSRPDLGVLHQDTVNLALVSTSYTLLRHNPRMLQQLHHQGEDESAAQAHHYGQSRKRKRTVLESQEDAATVVTVRNGTDGIQATKISGKEEDDDDDSNLLKPYEMVLKKRLRAKRAAIVRIQSENHQLKRRLAELRETHNLRLLAQYERNQQRQRQRAKKATEAASKTRKMSGRQVLSELLTETSGHGEARF